MPSPNAAAASAGDVGNRTSGAAAMDHPSNRVQTRRCASLIPPREDGEQESIIDTPGIATMRLRDTVALRARRARSRPDPARRRLRGGKAGGDLGSGARSRIASISSSSSPSSASRASSRATGSKRSANSARSSGRDVATRRRVRRARGSAASAPRPPAGRCRCAPARPPPARRRRRRARRSRRPAPPGSTSRRRSRCGDVRVHHLALDTGVE